MARLNEAYWAEIADFEERMTGLLTEIREAIQDPYIASKTAGPNSAIVDGVLNPYVEGDNPVLMPFATAYDYVLFRSDIDALTQRLERFVDGARPENFDDVAESLLEVESLLDEAQGHAGMGRVDTALSGWSGGAAGNFRNRAINPFHRVVTGQATLAKELGVAALSYKEIIGRVRMDTLDLASQLKQKLLDKPDDEIPLGKVLLVASAVFGGIAVATAAWTARLSWAAASSTLVLDGIADTHGSDEPSPDDRVLTGRYAAHFVPSLDDQLSKVWRADWDQEDAIKDGLKTDVRELDDAGGGAIKIREPDITDGNSVDDLGTREAEVEIEDIALLKRVGVADLPAIAELFNKALLKLRFGFHFDLGFGDGNVAGTYKAWFHRLLDELETAITRTRDHLYESGRNLSTIADNYYTTESDNQRLMEAVAEELEDFDEDTYRPPGTDRPRFN